jgi:uroporphyrinogen III methyltransferase / synthase
MSPRTGGPLAETRVVVTRAAHQVGGLEARLAAVGAVVERLPLLELAAPADPGLLVRAASRLGEVDWVVFTSANAVEALVAALPDAWPRGPRVAAVGRATEAALARHGVEVALVPRLGHAEGLVEELAPRLHAGLRLLLPQAADAREVLAAGLRRLPVEVETVVAYRKRLPAEAPSRFVELFARGPFGWVTFTSPSTARFFARLAGAEWPKRREGLLAASIGPVTSAALRDLEVEPAAQAETPSDQALVTAICAAVAGPRSPEPGEGVS